MRTTHENGGITSFILTRARASLKLFFQAGGVVTLAAFDHDGFARAVDLDDQPFAAVKLTAPNNIPARSVSKDARSNFIVILHLW